MTNSMPVNVAIMLPIWAGATDTGNGWRHSSWFGNFAEMGLPVVWHAEHGWIAPLGTDPSSIWYWAAGPKWLWTSSTVYPFVWSDQLHSWLWYYRNTGNGIGGWYYNYAAGQTQWM